ncbi:MAG: MCP four helix bundle domain-containing protein, partial [Beijerinckiaceae bacterium]
MSIKTSLLTAIVLLLIVLGGVAVVAKMRMAALQDTIETVKQDRLPKLRALGEINVLINRVRTTSYRVALTGMSEQREQAIRILNRRMDVLDGRIADFRRRLDGDGALRIMFEQFAAKWAQYIRSQAVILDPEASKDPVRFSHIMNVDTQVHFLAAVDVINDSIKLANQETDSLIDEAVSQSRFYATVLWFVSGFGVLIGIISLLFAVRGVSTPISHIKNSMKAMADGRLDADIPYADRSNDLGAMARSLTLIRKSLTENERVNAATRTLSELSVWLQSAKSEPELYEMISSVLGRLMPECRGSLFVYANSRDVLELATEWHGASMARTMHPDDCWSLRKGHPYVHGTSEIEFRCEHV